MSRHPVADVRPNKRRRLSPPDSEHDVVSGSEVSGLDSEDEEEEKDTIIENSEDDDDKDGEEEDVAAVCRSEVDMQDNMEQDKNEMEDQATSAGHKSGPTQATEAKTSGVNQSKAPPKPRRVTTSSTNMFQLQVEGLLAQVRPNYTTSQQVIGDALLKLKTAIEEIPPRDTQPLKEAERQLLKSHKIAIPFAQTRPGSDVMYKFGYSKPDSINVVGSYALKSAIRSAKGLIVDLVVRMPTELFEVKDYLNYRYFHKRAYYLACLAAGLQKSLSSTFSMKFASFNGNDLLPVLTVEPLQPDASLPKSDFTINIMPAIHFNFFPIEKTLPDRNCIRKATPGNDNMNQQQSATPIYNASLRHDSSVNSYLKLQHSAASKCEGFQDACVLGGIWLRQRGISGFGHFELKSSMALLLETGGPKGKPVLSPAYNSLQLFGATLHFFAHRDLERKPLFVESDDAFKTPGPMLFDGARGMNILYKVDSPTYRLLRREAQSSTKLFGSSSPLRFESLFALKLSEPLLRYDMLFVLDGPTEMATNAKIGIENIYSVLQEGLGDRAALLDVIQSPGVPWSVKIARNARTVSLTVGVVFHPGNASRTVDRGPSAEDAAGTVKFREFWGEKAELRRFRDGEIRESLVWNGNEPGEITREIVLFLIGKHLSPKLASECRVVGGSVDMIAGLSLDATKQQVAHNKTLAAYRTLEPTIRSLEGLPLQVRQIQPAGAKLRNTAVLLPKAPSPTDIVIQFEGSNRWPDDITAVQMTKIGFLLKLGELLKGNKATEMTRLGLENQKQVILNQAFLDVLHSGEWFRIRIHHEREQVLIGRRLFGKAATPRQREDAALALTEYKRAFLQAPVHAQTMQKLATEFPVFSQTVRLVKLWFSTQLLGPHFREELIEVITAKVFVDPQPWSVPSSPTTGFLRTLSFLAQWNWQQDPLIVDTSGSMKTAEISAINTKFEAWRQIDPLMNRVSLFVATSFDPEGTTWSEYLPSKVVAARMSGLAKAAMKFVQERGLELKLTSMLKPTLNEYDFVIRLKQKSTADTEGQTKFKNLRREQAEDLSMAGFDPAHLFLEELEAIYGDAVLFFADTLNGGIIAGLWSPHTERRRWKINIAWSTMPTTASQETDCEVVANKDAMLSEMVRLGGDLVDSLERR